MIPEAEASPFPGKNRSYRTTNESSAKAFPLQDEVISYGTLLIAGGRIHQTLTDRRFLDGAHHAVGQGVQNFHVLCDVARVNPGDQPLLAEHVIGDGLFVQAVGNHIATLGGLHINAAAECRQFIMQLTYKCFIAWFQELYRFIRTVCEDR